MAAGVPFTFQISASNAPTSFDHSALPTGLRLHPVTGLLTGTLAAPGDYLLSVSANNASGSGAKQTLTVRALAQNTYRGWAIARGLTAGSEGPLDAPLGDGVKNLHRFAFALAPTGGSLAGLPVPVIVTEPGGTRYLALDFTRTRDLAGVTFRLRRSDTLGGFLDVAATIEVLETINAATERVRLRATATRRETLPASRRRAGPLILPAQTHWLPASGRVAGLGKRPKRTGNRSARHQTRVTFHSSAHDARSLHQLRRQRRLR